MNGMIFINYRCRDDPGFAGRLFDQLRASFGSDELFFDVESIPPGQDFVAILEEQVYKCDVLLAIIGGAWLHATNSEGLRCLDDPTDFVRIEIASALEQEKLVIPVLVNDAAMPKYQELPLPLHALARCNAVRLSHESFTSDVKKLIDGIRIFLDNQKEKNAAEWSLAEKIFDRDTSSSRKFGSFLNLFVPQSKQRSASAEYQYAIDNADVALWRWTSKGDQLVFGNLLERILRLDTHSVPRKVQCFIDYVHPSDREEFSNTFSSSRQHDHENRFILFLLLTGRKSGTTSGCRMCPSKSSPRKQVFGNARTWKILRSRFGSLLIKQWPALPAMLSYLTILIQPLSVNVRTNGAMITSA